MEHRLDKSNAIQLLSTRPWALQVAELEILRIYLASFSDPRLSVILDNGMKFILNSVAILKF